MILPCNAKRLECKDKQSNITHCTATSFADCPNGPSPRICVAITVVSDVKGRNPRDPGGLSALNEERRAGIHVLHTASQTRLNRIRVPSISPHDDSPAQTGKDRPRVPRHLRAHNLAHATYFLHRHLCQSQHRACKHVDDDLLVNATLNAATENSIAAYQPGKESVWAGFFPGRGGGTEYEHGTFIDDGVRGEVAGVLAGRLEDEV